MEEESPFITMPSEDGDLPYQVTVRINLSTICPILKSIFFFPHKEQYRKISSQPNSSRIDDRIHHNHQKPRKKKEIIFLDYSFSSATQKERKNIRVCLFVCLLPCLFPEEETATKRAVQSLNTEKSSADTERGQQPSTEFPHSLALSLPHSSF